MIDYRFIDAAAEELNAAVLYYETQQSGLGQRFLTEIENSITFVRRFPATPRLISKRSRRWRVKGFPYGIIYQVRDNQVVIIAIMNFRRRPGYWHGESKVNLQFPVDSTAQVALQTDRQSSTSHSRRH